MRKPLLVMQGADTMNPRSLVPDTITEDRAARLTPSQVASNRRALLGDLYQLVLSALRPYLAEEDLFAVSQALCDIIINEACSTMALVDILAQKLPVLHCIGSYWGYIAVWGTLSLCV
jgi:hypothetical protein